MHKMVREKRMLPPATSTGTRRKPPRLVLIAKNQLLHQRTLSLHLNGSVIRLSSHPHEQTHLLVPPRTQKQSSGSAFSSPRRPAS